MLAYFVIVDPFDTSIFNIVVINRTRFAADGLRTLMISKRELQVEEYNQWSAVRNVSSFCPISFKLLLDI
jgi:hypothetical protein